jgi:hypothetical protein
VVHLPGLFSWLDHFAFPRQHFDRWFRTPIKIMAVGLQAG